MNQRMRLTKKLFHDALIELLQDKTIDQISVRELCEKADLNRSTFYLHYTDIYQLLKEIENELIQISSTAISKNIHDLTPFLQYIQNNQKTLKVLLINPSLYEFSYQYVENAVRITSQTISFDQKHPLENYIYRYIVDGCLGVIRKWIENNCLESINDVSLLLYDLCDIICKNITIH